MSADNYYIVRRNGDGFSPVMGFMSAGETPLATKRHPVFPTPEDALAAAASEYSEYGASIHAECYENGVTVYASQLAGGHVGLWMDSGSRRLKVTKVVQSEGYTEVHTKSGGTSYRPDDVVELYWTEDGR